MDDNEFYISAGAYLRELREKNNYSLGDIAHRLGTARVTVMRYETGERKPPLGVLKKLCSIYGISLNDLFDRFQEYL
ncbi:MAG TPA: hypothetical protein DCQ90_06590 [Erysipelotrichaceae bacterium]|nr:hypothetical protein [Erysipelotrichaceae bacterium]